MKEVPEQFGYVLHLAEDNACGVRRKAVLEMLDGALVRSRLKKVDAPHQLTLAISAACQRRGRMLLYYIAADFARLTEDGIWIRYGEQPTFRLETGDGEELLGRLQDLVNDTLMAYLRANFEL